MDSPFESMGVVENVWLNIGTAKNDGSDHIYDITKIKDITDGTAGQALIKVAGSVSDIFNNSITDSTEKVNSETKFSYKASAESKVYKQIAEW